MSSTNSIQRSSISQADAETRINFHFQLLCFVIFSTCGSMQLLVQANVYFSSFFFVIAQTLLKKGQKWTHLLSFPLNGQFRGQPQTQERVKSNTRIYIYIICRLLCVRASNIDPILNSYQAICRTPQRYSFIQLNKFDPSGVLRWLFRFGFIRLQARCYWLLYVSKFLAHRLCELLGIDLKRNNI